MAYFGLKFANEASSTMVTMFRICKFLGHSILFRCLIMVKNLCQNNKLTSTRACCKIICGTCVLLPLPVSPSKQTTLAVPQITGITSKGRVMSIFFGKMSIDFAKNDGIPKWLACEENRTIACVVSRNLESYPKSLLNHTDLGSLFLDGKEPLLAGSPAVGCLLPVLESEAS